MRLFSSVFNLYTQLTNSYLQQNCKVQASSWTNTFYFPFQFFSVFSQRAVTLSTTHISSASKWHPSNTFSQVFHMNFLSLLHSSYMFSPPHFHYKYSNNTRWYVKITTLPSVNEISAEFLILTTVLVKIQTFWDVTLFGLAYKCLFGLGLRRWRHQATAKCW